MDFNHALIPVNRRESIRAGTLNIKRFLKAYFVCMYRVNVRVICLYGKRVHTRMCGKSVLISGSSIVGYILDTLRCNCF